MSDRRRKIHTILRFKRCIVAHNVLKSTVLDHKIKNANIPSDCSISFSDGKCEALPVPTHVHIGERDASTWKQNVLSTRFTFEWIVSLLVRCHLSLRTNFHTLLGPVVLRVSQIVYIIPNGLAHCRCHSHTQQHTGLVGLVDRIRSK